MVSSEAWMGSGTSITMAPEADLFLGYMPYGPTLGRSGTTKAHLIKYSLGYALDGASVLIENAHGEQKGSETLVGHFTDYYHLVPDLYTGCIAKFYYSASSSTAATLRFTAIVAGNDADAVYFGGNLADFPNLYADTNAVMEDGRERGYIILSKQGAVVPAPISLEKRNSSALASSYIAGDNELTLATGTDGTCENLNIGNILYTSGGKQVGVIWGFSANATALTMANHPEIHDGASTDDTIHILSDTLGTLVGGSTQSDGIGSITVPADLTGILTAGDWISKHADTRASAVPLGIVVSLSSSGLVVTYAQYDANTASAADEIYWGRHVASDIASNDHIYTVYPRILSDNWIGLTNTITPPNVDIEIKPLGLAMMGTRNITYQYKGMETASAASIDANLNHGTWLHYALGSTALTEPPNSGSANVDAFQAKSANASIHETWVALDASDDAAGVDTGPFFHRVLNGSNALCPPIMPTYTAKVLTNVPSVTAGVASNTFTYTFSERNDASLPSFALELVQQKASKLTDAPMVDRNTYNEECYAQVFPGCVVNTMTLSANENEEVKATLDLNVKRVFEAPDGYMGRCYDATNNLTNEFRNLYNFGQITGDGGSSTAGTITQEFLTPFFFSDGTVSLFGQEFLSVSSFSLSINNTVTDKRYIGNYSKQIKMSVPGQRTYEVTMTALVTDRRLFDELRKESSTRSTLTSESVIQLLLTKDDGEQIKLQFDDYMITTNMWPVPEDKGPIYVDFTIIPLQTQVVSAISSWVMQG